MFIGSKKFLSGVNRTTNPVTTLEFNRTAASGAGQYFSNVFISGDDAGGQYTKLGDGNYTADDVIAGANVNSLVPVELNPGTYSLKVINPNPSTVGDSLSGETYIRSGYTPAGSQSGQINIGIARVLNMFDPVTSLSTTDAVSTTPITLTDDTVDNFDIGDNNYGLWDFSDFDVAGGTYGSPTLSDQDPPFQFITQFTISSADATRVTYGGNADDTSVAIHSVFNVPNSGLQLNAKMTLELTEGYF